MSADDLKRTRQMLSSPVHSNRHPGITIPEAKENIGRGVVYRPPGRREGDVAEDGVIVSVTEYVVFVRYAGDVNAKGTYPQDLEWLTP